MNNKTLGTAFEKELCQKLQAYGFWVHFISPNHAGAQPFDVIASMNNVPIAIDCKTSARASFPVTRLEDNQIFAFSRWLECGNRFAVIAVKYKDEIYFIDFQIFLSDCTGIDGGVDSVRLAECKTMKEWLDEYYC